MPKEERFVVNVASDEVRNPYIEGRGVGVRFLLLSIELTRSDAHNGAVVSTGNPWPSTLPYLAHSCTPSSSLGPQSTPSKRAAFSAASCATGLLNAPKSCPVTTPPKKKYESNDLRQSLTA